MTDTPDDRTPEDEESKKPGSDAETPNEAERETEVIPHGQESEEPTEKLPEVDATPEPVTAATGSGGGSFRLGTVGRRVATGAAIAAAFVGGMAVYGAIDGGEAEPDQAAFVTPEGSGGPGIPGGPGMPGPGAPGGDPDWSHEDDDHGPDDSDDTDRDDQYEDRDDHHEDRYGDDDRYEHEEMVPGGQSGSDRPGPAPMQSGQS